MGGISPYMSIMWPSPVGIGLSNHSRVFLLPQLWIVIYYLKKSQYWKHKHSVFLRKNIIKIVHFGILIHILSWRQQKNQCSCFHYRDYLSNIWHNDWCSRKTQLLWRYSKCTTKFMFFLKIYLFLLIFFCFIFQMRDTNESTNSRVLYFSIFSMCCLLGLATWQVLYLRKYFKSKKLIE